jgi:phosphatidate cytidylyltransferase
MGLFLAATALTCLAYGGPALLGITMFGTVVGLYEYYKLLEKKNIRPMTVLGILAGALFMLLAYSAMKKGDMLKTGSSFGTVITFFVLLVLLIQFVQLINHRVRYSILYLSTTVFGSIYIGGFMSMLFLLLGFGMKQFPNDVFHSRLVIFLPMWSAWGTDVGAYFVGSFFGKTKVFPDISPNKTLEGCLGGLCISTAVFCVLGSFLKLPLAHSIIVGAAASAAGIIGDFSESALKRELGVKDSGKIFGSHGGVLDRIDSFLFTVPVIYYYFIWYCPWVK